MAEEAEADEKRILAQFKSESGDVTGNAFDLPLNITAEKLQMICNALLTNEDPIPYSFFVNDIEVTDSLVKALDDKALENTEQVLDIVYLPQAIFRVRAVTRCTSTIPGHAEAVISVSFSPDGRYLASGSGDTTVRFWDVQTETPHHTCKGHKHWVLCIAWSPDGKKLASGCKNSQICVWDPDSGHQKGKTLTGHKQWITWLSWKPFHLDPECRFLASSSKDGTIKIWDTLLSQCHITLSGHLQSVTCIKWGGTDLIYSASQDRTIKVWRAEDLPDLKLKSDPVLCECVITSISTTGLYFCTLSPSSLFGKDSLLSLPRVCLVDLVIMEYTINTCSLTPFFGDKADRDK
ncbi:notchless protein homolog 1-like, partial [Saccostrea cucullata]|uniref:notchless protein homolog 1-like n=1 Tax=Saccostrea cuccullata TaxID=36930 RepID=UPI002ED46FFD